MSKSLINRESWYYFKSGFFDVFILYFDNYFLKKLEQEIDCLKKSKESVEFQLSMANSDYEHSLTKLKMYYEEKQKGLLPNDIKKVFYPLSLIKFN